MISWRVKLYSSCILLFLVIFLNVEINSVFSHFICSIYWLLLHYFSALTFSLVFMLYRYTFLDKFVGISTVFEINRDTLLGNMSQMVESHLPLHVPQVEGLIIPSRTRGHVVKMVDGNTALVRWEVNGYVFSSCFGLSFLLMSLVYSMFIF